MIKEKVMNEIVCCLNTLNKRVVQAPSIGFYCDMLMLKITKDITQIQNSFTPPYLNPIWIMLCNVLALYSGEVLFAALGVWLHGLLPRLPPSRANFIGVVLHVLQGLRNPTKATKGSNKNRL